jgi:hypothetical protein
MNNFKVNFLNEYKHRQSAQGLRVTAKAFSIVSRFPIIQKFDIDKVDTKQIIEVIA